MPGAREIHEAYALCERMTRSKAVSFWAALRLLPPAQRLGMAALYAFCRRADDIADGPGTPEARLARLAEMRRALERGLWGLGEDPVARALADASRRFAIRREDLLAVVDGVAMDCAQVRYATFADLRLYCERVASAVGCASVAVFGAPGEGARAKARALGVALQLANILRDLREDALAGRCYLPEEELARFGVSGADLGRPRATAGLRRLVSFQIVRARSFLRESAGLEAMLPRATRFFPAALAAVYRLSLAKLESAGCDPLERPPRVGRLEAGAVTVGVYARHLVR